MPFIFNSHTMTKHPDKPKHKIQEHHALIILAVILLILILLAS